VPAHAVHTFRNVSTAASKLLVTLLPGNFEQFFRAVGTPVGEGALPDLNQPPDPTLVDVPALLAAAPAYGLRFIL
jgi:hypothetical protein